jgi:hypothetical protein
MRICQECPSSLEGLKETAKYCGPKCRIIGKNKQWRKTDGYPPSVGAGKHYKAVCKLLAERWS